MRLTLLRRGDGGTCERGRYGAHQIGGDEAAGRQTEGEAFAEEGIDMILQNRTEKRQIGSRAGNSFSTATFPAPDVRSLPGTEAATYCLDRLSVHVVL